MLCWRWIWPWIWLVSNRFCCWMLRDSACDSIERLSPSTRCWARLVGTWFCASAGSGAAASAKIGKAKFRRVWARIGVLSVSEVQSVENDAAPAARFRRLPHRHAPATLDAVRVLVQ